MLCAQLLKNKKIYTFFFCIVFSRETVFEFKFSLQHAVGAKKNGMNG
jgi:hypothetical protein